MTKLQSWILNNKGCLLLAAAVIANLNSWHQHDVTITDHNYPPLLQEAIRQQARIGWQSFIEGFWSKHWRQHQQQYLTSINSQRSSLLWTSKLQRRIWHIAWTLWDHRNQILHADGGSIHQYESTLLDQEIIAEWNNERTLPQQYSHLFRGDLEARLQSNTQHKRQWITSVWTAQENQSHVRQDRNEHIVNNFERWKARNSKNI